eukprot:6533444-Pyramimonas_sp.AAC.1
MGKGGDRDGSPLAYISKQQFEEFERPRRSRTTPTSFAAAAGRSSSATRATGPNPSECEEGGYSALSLSGTPWADAPHSGWRAAPWRETIWLHIDVRCYDVDVRGYGMDARGYAGVDVGGYDVGLDTNIRRP